MGVEPISVPQSLAYVLANAGDRNGVDFDYLLQTAIRESSLDPTARARTSSATGLFQFLDSTWLQAMKEHGPGLGYSQYADQIRINSEGRYVVDDPDARAAILALREDPQISADLAAAFTRANGEYLSERFGRMPSPGELYIAHFLGAQGAERMFRAGLQDPDQIAADLFPRQASANRAIFYDSDGPRTIREVYRALVARHETETSGTTPTFATQQLASQPELPLDLDPLLTPDNMSFTGLFSTQAAPGPATPLLATPHQPLIQSPVAAPAGNGAFFAQLYGQ
jgi:hypothetical protein